MKKINWKNDSELLYSNFIQHEEIILYIDKIIITNIFRYFLWLIIAISTSHVMKYVHNYQTSTTSPIFGAFAS